MHWIQWVWQAPFSFFTWVAGFTRSSTLSRKRCRFAENLKNLAISPMDDSVLLKAWILQVDTTARLSWCVAHYYFKILLEVLSYLRSLTLKLQMQALDVMYAYKQVNSVTSALKNMRELSDREFKRIFQEATTLGRKLHGESFELDQPRVNKCQMHQSNIPVTTAKQYYYRVSL